MANGSGLGLTVHIIQMFVWCTVDVVETVDPMRNPFKLPDDNEIFLLRDKEKQRKMQVNKRCNIPLLKID